MLLVLVLQWLNEFDAFPAPASRRVGSVGPVHPAFVPYCLPLWVNPREHYAIRINLHNSGNLLF